MKIENATSSTIAELWKKIEPNVQQSEFLEEGAQKLVTEIHARFDDSVVIARVFFTVPFDSLPPSNKEFVKNLAESAGVGAEIKGTTPVLSLIGTHGIEEGWNDRRKSKGHAGIPLISSAFVGAIPMISRLLKELGVPMDWVDSHDMEIIKKAIGGSVGLFFVENAAEATDHEGRKIIVAQDFVSKYDVKSVFGTGEAYDNGQMMVVVVFCRDVFSRDVAERFVTLASAFKGKTSSLVEETKIFS
jgi:histone H3/H4